jgi:hypothetical protein
MMSFAASNNIIVTAMKRYDDTALMIYFLRGVQGSSVFAKRERAGAI